MREKLRGYNLFPFVFTLWFSGEILQNTTLYLIAGLNSGAFFNRFNYIILLLLAVQIIFLQEYSRGQLTAISLLSAVILISAQSSAVYTMLSLWLFILAAGKTSFDDIVRQAYRILLVMIPLVILFHALGLLPGYNIHRGRLLRYSLGFSHPNTLGMRVFQLITCRLYCHRSSIRVRDFLYTAAACVFIFAVPNSQSPLVCVSVLLIGLILDRICRLMGPFFTELYRSALLILAALLNIFSVLWSLAGPDSSSLVSSLNEFLSNRFLACHRVFQIYGISVWGNRLSTGFGSDTISRLSERLYLDNAYMALLLRFGVLIYLSFSAALIAAIFFYKRKGDVIPFLILFTYSVYGIMENGLFKLSDNVFLFTFTMLLGFRAHDCHSGRMEGRELECFRN